jgi:Resolvase, N terminal domain
MEDAKPTLRRCAIYTRKSSEEGLEQNFNSLHAQREACEAFIKSQASEGWRLVKTHYDDGGISGGSMERPALQQLFDQDRHGVGAWVSVRTDSLAARSGFELPVPLVSYRNRALSARFAVSVG